MYGIWDQILPLIKSDDKYQKCDRDKLIWRNTISLDQKPISQRWDIQPTLAQCLSIVVFLSLTNIINQSSVGLMDGGADGGPTLNQHWINVS